MWGLTPHQHFSWVALTGVPTTQYSWYHRVLRYKFLWLTGKHPLFQWNAQKQLDDLPPDWTHLLLILMCTPRSLTDLSMKVWKHVYASMKVWKHQSIWMWFTMILNRFFMVSWHCSRIAIWLSFRLHVPYSIAHSFYLLYIVCLVEGKWHL